MNAAKRTVSQTTEASLVYDNVPVEASLAGRSPDVANQTEDMSEFNEGIVNPRTTVLAATLMLLVLAGIASLLLF